MFDPTVNSTTAATDEVASIEDRVRKLSDELLARIVKQLAPGSEKRSSAPSQTAALLTLNPYSCASRIPAQTTAKQTVAPEPSCAFASGPSESGQATLIDVPQFGFVLANVSESTNVKSRQRGLADNNGLLQNEFLEAQIDSQRGHLLSLHVPGRRGNRFSFSVARREMNGKQPVYSEMQAERCETLFNSQVRGIMRSTGRLINQGVSRR